jgi:hypothetical protein
MTPSDIAATVFLALAAIHATHTQCQDAAARASRLILLDGSSITANSLSIKDGKIAGSGTPVDLALDDLRRIERTDAAPASGDPPETIVEVKGGRIYAESVTIGDDNCRVRWRAGSPLELLLDQVRAIRFHKTGEEFERALAAPSIEHDRVLVRDDAGNETLVSGLVESLDAHQLKLDVNGQARALPLASVLGVVVAQPAAADPPQPVTVHFADTSRLSGHSLELENNQAELQLPGGNSAAFNWSNVHHLTVRSSRVAYLSDLKPVHEEQRPIVTAELPAQRDRNVTGGPLVLSSQSFEKGLGVHAYSAMTFDAAGKWDVLAATIGLDAATGLRGDCIFKVLADGETLFAERVRGPDDPRDMRLPITGRRQITLVVEPGQGLDLGDHANWCDARLIKK